MLIRRRYDFLLERVVVRALSSAHGACAMDAIEQPAARSGARRFAGS
jgi:hypothetical protein